MSEHKIRFVERTLASVRCACICGWKAEVTTREGDRQSKLNVKVAGHLAGMIAADDMTASELADALVTNGIS